MTRVTPYKLWTNQELKDKLINDVNDLLISGQLKVLWVNLIEESFEEGTFWDPVVDYNGCTVVQDMYHPCPACYVHDYMWINGMGGKMSDNLFYNLMLSEGMKKAKAMRRLIAVRIMWHAYFMWKYILIRRWKQPSQNMMALYQYFNS